jgi:prepilin peptidase CpaA
MPPLDVPHLVLAGILSGLLVWAAVSDARVRRIPNLTVLCVLGLYVVWALIGRGDGLGSALAAAGIGFAVGYGLYLFKIMGAGDVKLFAAAALFIGMAYLPLFALATVLTGGVIALVSLASSPRRAFVMFALKGKGGLGREIPYGVAISFGAAAVLWGALTGKLPANLLSSLHP